MATQAILNDGNVLVEPVKTAAQANGHASTSGVLHRSLHQDPLRVVSAKGNYLRLNNGQKVFDASGGAAVACLGHGDERSVVSICLSKCNKTDNHTG